MIWQAVQAPVTPISTVGKKSNSLMIVDTIGTIVWLLVRDRDVIRKRGHNP